MVNIPTPKEKQKFQRGDRVHIAKDLGKHMSHFQNDVDAIILYSYHNMFGGEDRDNWCVYLLPNGGSCAWYKTEQLTKIKGPRGKRLANKLDPPAGWFRLHAARPWNP